MIGKIEIDLKNLKKNWLYLNKLSLNTTETGAVVKADAYGLGVAEISAALWEVGNRSFFVANIEEAILLSRNLPKKRKIYVLNGYDPKYKNAFTDFNLIPVLNSPSQLKSFTNVQKNMRVSLQIDIGMRRLGFQIDEMKKYYKLIKTLKLELIIGHLSNAILPNHKSNKSQLDLFKKQTLNFTKIKKSLAASHGILINQNYHFDLNRPGIALFGGVRNKKILNVVSIELPVLQTHFLNAGEGIGYGHNYISNKRKKVATLSGGYADGLSLEFSDNGHLFYKQIPCPILGRISMDLVTVDISHLNQIPKTLTFLGPQQTINDLADKAKTISHEILINLGNRFSRNYLNA